MSGVIKAGLAGSAAGRIEPLFGLGAPHDGSAPILAAIADPRDDEIARLRLLLAEREAEISAHAEALDAARAEGVETGRKDAEDKFEHDREAALSALREGIEAARQALASSLERTEALALMLVRQALEKLFDDPGGRLTTIGALIARQLAEIGRDMVVGIEVSRLDFPDTREIAALAETLQVDPALVCASLDLSEGQCRMRLKLGAIDLGVDRQWGAVRALLDEHIEAMDSRAA